MKDTVVLLLIFIGQYTEYECTTLTRNTNAFSLLKWSFTFCGIYHTQYSSHEHLVCIFSFYMQNPFLANMLSFALCTSIVNCLTYRIEVAGEILVCHTHLRCMGEKIHFKLT